MTELDARTLCMYDSPYPVQQQEEKNKKNSTPIVSPVLQQLPNNVVEDTSMPQVTEHENDVLAAKGMTWYGGLWHCPQDKHRGDLSWALVHSCNEA